VRIGLALAVAMSIGCRGKDETTPPVPPTPTASDEQPPVAQPDFPEGTRSLVLTKTVGVRLDPDADAKRIGNVAIDTRVAWTRAQPGKGCDKAWIEIAPRGWVCGDHLEASKKSPAGQEVPQLDRGEIVPGHYGKVTASGAVTYVLEKPGKHKRRDKKKRNGGDEVEVKEARMVEDTPLVGSVNVREYDEIDVGGKTYWKIAQKDNQYVLRSQVMQHRPSPFGGTRLADDTGLAVPLAFVWPRYGMLEAYTMNKSTGGGINRQLPARMPVPVLETAADKAGKPLAYRIADSEWISAIDVRMFKPAPPPVLLEPNERWIDIDVDDQILVAYEGELPVYATLVSSGGKETPTETGVYRVWMKESEADMKGLNGEDPYSVATVPWTQFFSPEKGLALHTAYWHDQFGTRRSHGCVNLAPRDARWLYFWTDPQVPPGWTMTTGVVELPGSIVRIRSKDDPTPEVKGYAKKVLEQRQANAPAR
jgi:hypothetical protein